MSRKVPEHFWTVLPCRIFFKEVVRSTLLCFSVPLWPFGLNSRIRRAKITKSNVEGKLEIQLFLRSFGVLRGFRRLLDISTVLPRRIFFKEVAQSTLLCFSVPWRPFVLNSRIRRTKMTKSNVKEKLENSIVSGVFWCPARFPKTFGRQHGAGSQNALQRNGILVRTAARFSVTACRLAAPAWFPGTKLATLLMLALRPHERGECFAPHLPGR